MPALELGGITLGVREGVIVLITLVAIYMLFVLLRMRHLRNKPAPVAPPAEPAKPAESAPKQVDVDQSLEDAVNENPIESAAAWQRESDDLAEETFRQSLLQEVAQLRDEVDAIRGELAALREDLQQEVAHLHSAQPVSPIYGDAMQMAVAGYDPVMIADRCGIARAEAELVVALAKSQKQ